ncbi:uncharacterized protein FOMMEDRAFT_22377 [Fomitiporia mediterranea MF3/22]|uniref:uncharacterized protein n=1 Tax=Fomitiporia mediterranea (strain MF3/22) TaxID=694068 RepID=UPI00044098BC|nr:uncharacterized protein FOMMEDRAFT_22377 [Fomitiporia mediterranea MF3/22]EJD00623.1 hypothetical protein FOMMEDRAFT_22377 [Fomitiporia mediterranea MF3/22]
MPALVDAAVQTDPMPGSRSPSRDDESIFERQGISKHKCQNLEDDRDLLLLRIEQSLLETHRLLLELRKSIHKRAC